MFQKRNVILMALVTVLSLVFVAPAACGEAAKAAEAESFAGRASGYGGPIRITVFVSDGEITNVTAAWQDETEGIGTTAIVDMTAAMLKAKTWDVDAISGATLTSNAVKQAAKAAFEQAGLLPASAPEGQSAPETETAPGAETTAENESTAEPETFVGSASGYGGSIRVTVTVLDGRLVDLTATGRGETEGIGTTAVEKMSAAMLEGKTWDVDTISGATITGDAMQQAAKTAFENAGPLDTSVPEAEAVPQADSVAEPETFVGSASGYGGSIRATVTMLGGEWIDLTVTGRGETEGIGSTAVEKLTAAMLEAKTWDVDVLTGATITSDAIKEAAKKAMTQAGLIN